MQVKEGEILRAINDRKARALERNEGLRQYLKGQGMRLSWKDKPDSLHGWTEGDEFMIEIYDWSDFWRVIVKKWPSHEKILHEDVKTMEEVCDLLIRFYEGEQLELF